MFAAEVSHSVPQALALLWEILTGWFARSLVANVEKKWPGADGLLSS